MAEMIIPEKTWIVVANELSFYRLAFTSLLVICIVYALYSIWKSPARQEWIKDGIIDAIPVAKKIIRYYCPCGNWRYYAIYVSFFLIALMFEYVSVVWIGSVSYYASQHNSFCMHYGNYDPATMDPKLQLLVGISSFSLGVFAVFISTQILIDVISLMLDTISTARSDKLLKEKLTRGIYNITIMIVLALTGILFFIFSYYFVASMVQSFFQI